MLRTRVRAEDVLVKRSWMIVSRVDVTTVVTKWRCLGAAAWRRAWVPLRGGLFFVRLTSFAEAITFHMSGFSFEVGRFGWRWSIHKTSCTVKHHGAKFTAVSAVTFIETIISHRVRKISAAMYRKMLLRFSLLWSHVCLYGQQHMSALYSLCLLR